MWRMAKSNKIWAEILEERKILKEVRDASSQGVSNLVTLSHQDHGVSRDSSRLGNERAS
jgi:hypothetical protein